MSKSPKKPRKKKLLPKNVAELTDDQVVKKLFGAKAVREMNKIIDHTPPDHPTSGRSVNNDL